MVTQVGFSTALLYILALLMEACKGVLPPFHFSIIDAQRTASGRICVSALNQTQEELIYSYVSSSIIVRESGLTHLSGLIIDTSVKPSDHANSPSYNYYSPRHRFIPFILSIKRYNSSHCYINKAAIVSQPNVPYTTQTGGQNFTRIPVLTKHLEDGIPYSSLIFQLASPDVFLIKTDLKFYQGYFGEGMTFSYLRINESTIPTDWEDTDFYKVLSSNPSPLSLNSPSIDVMTQNWLLTYAEVKVNGAPLNLNTYVAKRVSDNYGYGYPLSSLDTFSVTGQTFKLSPCVVGILYHVFNVSMLNSLTSMRLVTSAKYGVAPYTTTVTVDFQLGNDAVYGVWGQLKVSATFEQNPSTNLMLNDTGVIYYGITLTSFLSDAASIYIAPYLQFNRIPDSFNPNYDILVFGNALLYTACPELGVTTGVKTFPLVASGSYIHSIDPRVYDNKVYSQTTVVFTPSSGSLDIRVRSFVTYCGGMPYDFYMAGYLTAWQTNNPKFCHILIPPVLQSAINSYPSSMCEAILPMNYSAYSPDCSSKFDPTDFCEYCDPDYGYDPINTEQGNRRILCVSKANCTTPDNYRLWVDTPTPATATNKALCLSCPLNCPTCTISGSCTSCSAYSTLTTTTVNGTTLDLCPCNMAGCMRCRDDTCDLCSPYRSGQSSGYLLYIETATDTRTCVSQTMRNCTVGYGLDPNYNVSTFPKTDYLACRPCIIQGCTTCGLDYASCTACDTGYSLVDKGLAIETDQMYGILMCINTHDVFRGLYENTTAGVYEQCINNCRYCTEASPTTCDECITNYHFSPKHGSCKSTSFCQSDGSGVFLSVPIAPLDQCQNCSANCAFCTNSTECIRCAFGYIYSQTNMTCIPSSQCGTPTMTYATSLVKYNGNSYPVCLECIPLCNTCLNGNSCQQCFTGYVYLSSIGACIPVADCSNVYHGFVDPATSNRMCTLCNRNCQKCTSLTTCDECNGFPTTTLAFHVDLNTCMQKSDCSLTTSSYFSTPFCHSCKTSCNGCTNGTDCYLCNSGLLLQTDGLTCNSMCLGASAPINTTHCQVCATNCLSCSFSPINSGVPQRCLCSSCTTGYDLDESSSCVNCSSLSNHFMLSGICTKCLVSNCETCSTANTICGTCMFGYSLNTDGTCSLCPSTSVYTADRRCIPCLVNNCLKCDNPDNTICLTCNSGYRLESEKSCVANAFFVLDDGRQFTSRTLEMKIKFSETTKPIQTDNVKAVFKITLPSNSESTIDITKIKPSTTDPTSVTFTLSSLPDFEVATPTLVFSEPALVKSAVRDLYQLSEDNKTVTFPDMTVALQEKKQAEQAAAAASLSMNVAMGVGVAVSFNYAMVMMKIYQMMDFNLLFNVNYPSNFEYFIDIFKTVDPLSMLPDIFTSIYDDNCPEMGEKFISHEMSCQFLSNCSTTVFIFLAAIAFKLIFAVIVWALSFGSNSFIKKVHAFLSKKNSTILGHEGLFVLFATFDVDLLLGSFTNIKYYVGDDKTNWKATLNNIFANIFVYSYPVLIAFYMQQTFKERIKHDRESNKNKQDDSGSFFFLVKETLSKKSLYLRYLEVWNLIRNYLICLCVVAFYENPPVQIATTAVSLLATLALESYYRPKKSRLDNILSSILWLVYSSLCLLFLILYFKGRGMEQQNIDRWFGYPMMALFCLLVASNILPILLATIMLPFSLFKKIKNKMKGKAEVKNISHRIDGIDNAGRMHTKLIQRQESNSMIMSGPLNAKPGSRPQKMSTKIMAARKRPLNLLTRIDCAIPTQTAKKSPDQTIGSPDKKTQSSPQSLSGQLNRNDGLGEDPEIGSPGKRTSGVPKKRMLSPRRKPFSQVF